MDSLFTLKCHYKDEVKDFTIGRRQLMNVCQYFHNLLTEYPNITELPSPFTVEEWTNVFEIVNAAVTGKYVALTIDSERYIQIITFHDFYNEKYYRSKLDSKVLFTELQSWSYYFLMDRTDNDWRVKEYRSSEGIKTYDDISSIVPRELDCSLEELKDKLKNCKIKYQTCIFYYNITVPGDWYQVIWLTPLVTVKLKDITGEYMYYEWVDKIPKRIIEINEEE